MKIPGFVFFIVCSLLTKCFAQQPKYEFRAAWIATVDNIDWPSRGNYNTESQKAEFTRLLDTLQSKGMNVVIVQVRPATDAFYPSPYEPWSEWLTGKQGRPPYPYYDPLLFMIQETHKRGMEFHAWCNPYRAEFQIGKSSISPTHITRVHPEWFLSYGGKRYFDPGNKDGQDFVVKVIKDIVNRYDVDALHFDDYFYPYRIAGKEFPDEKMFNAYGNGMNKEDWRRSNVDSIIAKLSRAIKEEKPYCKFGISPFGVWRNKEKDSLGSDTKAGQTNYDDLYADILMWLKNGYIDYVVPQLYWEHGHKAAPYEVLVDWWAKNSFGKQCYIGLGMYKAGSNTRWRDKNIIPLQIQDARRYATVQGQVYFSASSLFGNINGWSDSLKQHYYKYPALLPPMQWIDSTKPSPPIVANLSQQDVNGVAQLKISVINIDKEKTIRKFALYAFPSLENTDIKDKAPYFIIPATQDSVDYALPLPALLQEKIFNKEIYIGVTAVDADNMESDMSMLQKIQWSNETKLWEVVK
ncbi:MAG: family 10 glycosylhydrolase [Agriterribacter sp.]